MPLIGNGRAVADPGVTVANDAEVPATGEAIVALARPPAEREALTRRAAPIGVRFGRGLRGAAE